MTKEEARLAIMGAISMELKNPTLQQGFEIICKNLADLEKENKALGERCLQLQKDKGNLTDENNELKAQIEKMKCCVVSHCEGCERLPELYKELEK